ncbi:hypothetical protein Tco_1564039 [Tanacetum coccineum]
MAQLKYCDKHNQVGFLFKPAESAGYTEIVDFLRSSKLRYALTHNPPIYDSLVKQFWQTATARTLADGTQQLNATIDSIDYTITEEYWLGATPISRCFRDYIQFNPMENFYPYILHLYKLQKWRIGSVWLATILPLHSSEEEELRLKRGKVEEKSDDSQILQYKERLLLYKQKVNTAGEGNMLREEVNTATASLKLNAELSKSMIGSELQGEFLQREWWSVNSKKENPRIWKLTQLKKLSFEEVNEEFDKLVK